MLKTESETKSISFASNRSRRLLEEIEGYGSAGELSKVLNKALVKISTLFQKRIKEGEPVDSLSFDLHFIQEASASLSAENCATSVNTFHHFNKFTRETLTTYKKGLKTYSTFADKNYKKTVNDASEVTQGLRSATQNLAQAIAEADPERVSDCLKAHAEQLKKLDEAQTSLAKPEALQKVAKNLVNATQEALKQNSSNFAIQKWQEEIEILLASPASPERDAQLNDRSDAIRKVRKEEIKQRNARYLVNINEGIAIAEHLLTVSVRIASFSVRTASFAAEFIPNEYKETGKEKVKVVQQQLQRGNEKVRSFISEKHRGKYDATVKFLTDTRNQIPEQHRDRYDAVVNFLTDTRTYLKFAKGTANICLGLAGLCGKIALSGGVLAPFVVMAEGANIISSLFVEKGPTLEEKMLTQIDKVAEGLAQYIGEEFKQLTQNMAGGFVQTQGLIQKSDQLARERYVHLMQSFSAVMKQVVNNGQISRELQFQLSGIRDQFDEQHKAIFGQDYLIKRQTIY
ncbi:MAG: hypothetical protein KKA99_05400, partial [Gammaproteobacteria bacterium]|nr:hypothetical protein [Gammaproteobacteria bacterium]